ncbi:ATP-binding protein [Gelidibacter salicanalis]|uniref:ATP-binding protein n=1 Tax=Gelidibacter salicanalis TaxID=291193 RepID=A0A5C7AH22_9FLAO|nr:ATP-binding protein [Gelidibacter salicanalis]TXE07848.1 ATP-binding protein [Gelidibacter salicanalis]
MDKNNSFWLELNRSYLMTSIQMTMDELSFHFSESGIEKPFEKSDESTKLLEEIGNISHRKPNLDVLVERCQLSEFEKNILLVCAGIELNSTYSQLISNIQGNPEAVYPSFNLLLSGFCSTHWDAISPISPLRKWDLIHFNSGTLLANQPMKIDEGILHYLTGFSFLEEQLASLIKRDDEKYLITESQQYLVKQIVSDYSKNVHSPKTIELNGIETKDKMAVAKNVCEKLGFTLYNLDAILIPQKLEDVIIIEKLWNRQASLNRFALYIDCSNSTDDQQGNNNTLNHFVKNCKDLVFIGQDASQKTLSKNPNRYEVEKPSQKEQKLLWVKLLNDGDEHSKIINTLVEHFNLSANGIKVAAHEINQADSHSNYENLLWKTCCKHTRPVLENLAQRIETLATWSDIVLPREDIKMLKEITMHVKYRSKVYNEGGFAKKQSRGLGISALFSGESGTGKTMAAEVIANDLMLDLYRVDLSQVVNKYIGETEKNLKKIFDAAEEGGAILLFDEADALFGKRGEVRDSHDRHSNLQIGYLLQRMENFNGLAILTTNMKNAIDKAFERRIRFSLHFERPDVTQRKRIWEKAFPNKEWVNGVDYTKLALANIPGGNIKNIAMNAAFLAASENVKIGMHHLLQATKSEYKKVDKHLSNSEIKDWE